MADDKLAELLKTQQSLTEWLQDIGHTNTEDLRREDNEKRERLKVLNQLIGLPFDRPTQFSAKDLADKSEGFVKYLAEHADELCALRLIPTESGLPKLRMRGKSVKQAYEWFKEQSIDHATYRADFIPHVENTSWATIFIVNQHGLQGEITRGGHHQLTQGFHDDGAPPIVFRYDFKRWALHPNNIEARKHLQTVAEYLHVPDSAIRRQLTDALGASFSHNYLEGYFETTDSPLGTWFIDYSPSLGKLYADFDLTTRQSTDGSALVSGQVGCRGHASGPVQIVDSEHIDAPGFPGGAILVCAVTTPKFVPLMQKAAAIVTDQGGILSHAAIVARELKKPCIVATGNATSALSPGQMVHVDADSGMVLAT